MKNTVGILRFATLKTAALTSCLLFAPVAMATNTFPANGNAGIGTAAPGALLDIIGVTATPLHVGGSGVSTAVNAQGAYLNWNALTGGTGETDFINNQGGGTGGFAFFNTPNSGSPRSTLVTITGSGNLGIGSGVPVTSLDVQGGNNPILHVTGSGNPYTPNQGAYFGWNALTAGTGETDFINNQGGGSGGFAFFNTPASGTPRTALMILTGSGNLGIGGAPVASLDVQGGTNPIIHVAGSAKPSTPAQGAYLSWNSLTGDTGETDFINHQGGGNGGFAFLNTSGAGTARTALMFITGAGNVGIKTTTPGATVDVAGGIRAGSSTIVTACNSGTEGTQRYNYSTHNMEFCNGSAWTAMCTQ